MSSFTEFVQSFFSKGNTSQNNLKEYNTYEKIYDAPMHIKAQITNNLLNKIKDAPYVDLCEFTKKYFKIFNAIHAISVLAKLKMVAEEAKFEIGDEYWNNISIDKNISNKALNEAIKNFIEFFKEQDTAGQFCQNIAFAIMGNEGNTNIETKIESISVHIYYASVDKNTRETIWLPSAHYSVFSAMFENTFEAEAFRILGFGFGLPASVKHYHELLEKQEVWLDEFKNGIGKK